MDNITPVGTSGPQMIEVDGAGGKMYWANFGSAAVYRADLDGSDSESLFSRDPAMSTPAGIALHVSQGKMYWTSQ